MIRRTANPRRSGVTAVEFAVVVPVVIMLLMAIFEYGRFVFMYTTATNAVREGARYAAVHTGDGTTTATVKTQIDNFMAGARGQLQGYTTNVFWADPIQLAATTPTVVPKPGYTGVDDWKETPFGEKIACEVTGTFRPVAATIIRASATISVKVNALVTCEAN